jgi:hypothetical protein
METFAGGEDDGDEGALVAGHLRASGVHRIRDREQDFAQELASLCETASTFERACASYNGPDDRRKVAARRLSADLLIARGVLRSLGLAPSASDGAKVPSAASRAG